MTYTIAFSDDARRHLGSLAARDRRTVLDAIEGQLTHEIRFRPGTASSCARTPLADWELREGEFRVFYEVDGTRVAVPVVAVGVKVHNVLRIDGEEFLL